ncbi:hypothetical protein EVAR_31300_1 [Eumeta japonica]|uniref:Uncharacterized protein n=1 Tax=Eumeta variegata TaxID=151549 RepID=A0A4C1VTN6_EUMVA|nr:hypothetical protein EVAR_31300_1 [Eumeta japonica]
MPALSQPPGLERMSLPVTIDVKSFSRYKSAVINLAGRDRRHFKGDINSKLPRGIRFLLLRQVTGNGLSEVNPTRVRLKSVSLDEVRRRGAGGDQKVVHSSSDLNDVSDSDSRSYYTTKITSMPHPLSFDTPFVRGSPRLAQEPRGLSLKEKVRVVGGPTLSNYNLCRFVRRQRDRYLL